MRKDSDIKLIVFCESVPWLQVLNYFWNLPLLRLTSIITLSLGFVAFNENVVLSELKELFSLVMHILELSD